jgi:flavodoxin
MNIGIIVHSQSGHTAYVAKAIAEYFRVKGHDVDCKLILTSGMTKPGSKRFTICNTPDEDDVNSYDVIIFGAPVWGFKPCRVITKYIGWLKNMDNKKMMSIVTMALPWKSFGGNQSILGMNNKLRETGGTVLPGEIFHYFFGINKQRLNAAIERIYSNITEEL